MAMQMPKKKLQAEKDNLKYQIIEQSKYPSKWAEKDVNTAINMGIVPDTLQDRYAINITRSEMCDLLVCAMEYLLGHSIEEALGLEEGESLGSAIGNNFWDTYNPNVTFMNNLGIVSGYGNGKFGPYDNITREQAATILMNFIKFVLEERDPANGTVASFNDMGSISGWAKNGVEYVTSRKGCGYSIMGSSGNNNFEPKAGYTREQAIITVYRMCGYIVETYAEVEINSDNSPEGNEDLLKSFVDCEFVLNYDQGFYKTLQVLKDDSGYYAVITLSEVDGDYLYPICEAETGYFVKEDTKMIASYYDSEGNEGKVILSDIKPDKAEMAIEITLEAGNDSDYDLSTSKGTFAGARG